MQFIAHGYLTPQNEWKIHTVEEHLRDVATLCSEFSAAFGAEEWAYLAGLWHDLGKYSNDFQQRICKGIGHPIDERHQAILGQRVKDHATAGALLVAERLQQLKVPETYPIYHFITHAIAGHHAGLPDWYLEASPSDLRNRLEIKKECLSKVRMNQSAIPDDIWEAPIPKKLGNLRQRDPSLLIRMVFSSLIDADRLDTEGFYDPGKKEARRCPVTLKNIQLAFEHYLQETIYPKRSLNPLNQIRYEILQNCLEKASEPQGIFSLTVPTGGGKTLSSMAFALKHAILHHKRRVIYVIPYTSIIEQNADVFRKAFEALGHEVILEHHSNFDFDAYSMTEEDDDEIKSQTQQTLKLATENWDMPIIITTAVQFFESLFSAHPGRCRKLHNIANSVVVLDEAQMLPLDYFKPIRSYIRELAKYYGVTFVLSTATQPAFDKPLKGETIPLPVREIITDPQALYQQLNTRVQVTFPQDIDTPRSWQDLASEILAHNQSVLCIVNRKRDAKILYEELNKYASTVVVHLSTNMCAAHRASILTEVRGSLHHSMRIIVVSTQLVEAGVDLDFPIVYRALTGIDSIAQAAGRCNREGKLSQSGQVFVFVPPEQSPPGHLTQMESVSRLLAKTNPGLDVLGLDNVRHYFERLFLQYSKDLDTFDVETLLKNYNFKTAAKAFKIIKDDTTPVLVPYGLQGQALIDELETITTPDFRFLRKIQRYTVNVWDHALKKAHAEGLITQHKTMQLYYVPSTKSANQVYNTKVGLILDGDYSTVRNSGDAFII